MGKLKLELWLKEKGVPEASSVLAELGVSSMEGLCGLSSGNKKVSYVRRCIAGFECDLLYSLKISRHLTLMELPLKNK